MSFTKTQSVVSDLPEMRRTFRDGGVLRQNSTSALHAFYLQAEQSEHLISKRGMLGGLMKQPSMSALMSPRGGLRRSTSQNALFNEPILQVPIKDCNDPENSDSSVFSDASTTADAAEHELQVHDALLETSISVLIRSSTTFTELRDQIQAAQGRAGLRIIPSHVQVITMDGKSDWSDSCRVLEVLEREKKRGASAELVVEPLVTELISFFLASVNNLAATGPSSPNTAAASSSDASPAHDTQPLASPQSDTDLWNDDFFSLGEMEGHETSLLEQESEPSLVAHASPPSSNGSPPSPVAKSPVECRLSELSLSAAARPVQVPSAREKRVVSWLGDGHSLAPLDVDAAAEAVLSARVTPSAQGDGVQHYGTSYEGASVLAALYAQRDGTDGGEKSADQKGVLDVTLLRAVGDAGDLYATQSHLIMRNPEACLPLLQRLKLGALERLVLEVQSGLRHGHTPEELQDAGALKMDYGELVGGCTGGTYLMRNSKGKPTAIFKPMDEEPYAPANPKGFTGSMHVESDMRSGIPVGGGAARECAAYLLDHGGFSDIPSTAMLRISHSTLQASADAEVELKVGSLQRFEEHQCTVEDVGTSTFPVDLVHAIGVFDVRVYNMDRNSDNILYVPATADAKPRLVPIDHGYILPSLTHLEEVEACWLHWPQSKQPFGEATLAYIAELSAEADTELLRSTLALAEESLQTLSLGTTLLKKGAAAGLTLHDIGTLMTRARYDEPSAVERVVAACVEGAQGGAALLGLLDERVGALVHEHKVKCCFNRFGEGMHKRINSHCALMELVAPRSEGSESDREAI
mmetsp:Transcript_119538/g.178581  ORF Transcript_119538/g.178581 Transcript_119538/m.178581 type:complete len:808 (+) Transcript_119538:625-3048(+)